MPGSSLTRIADHVVLSAGPGIAVRDGDDDIREAVEVGHLGRRDGGQDQDSLAQAHGCDLLLDGGQLAGRRCVAGHHQHQVIRQCGKGVNDDLVVVEGIDDAG